MAFVLSLFVHLSFFQCNGRAVLRDCGISGVPSFAWKILFVMAGFICLMEPEEMICVQILKEQTSYILLTVILSNSLSTSRQNKSFNTNEPQRQETYLQTSVPREDSDQPAHSRSLIRIFTGCILNSQGAIVSS